MRKEENPKKGKPEAHRSEAEILEAAKKVCDLYSSGEYTIASCCEACGVDDRMFRYWVRKYPEVSEFYKKAKNLQDEIFFDMVVPSLAKRALIRLMDGEEYVQNKSEEGVGPMGAITKNTKTEVRVLPNATATIFALKGVYPDRFVDRTQATVNGDFNVSASMLPPTINVTVSDIKDKDDKK